MIVVFEVNTNTCNYELMYLVPYSILPIVVDFINNSRLCLDTIIWLQFDQSYQK